MSPKLRISLIGLLVVAASHVPLPWVHRHDNLTPQQLAIHLQRFHQDLPAERIPTDWHCHLLRLAGSPEGGIAADKAVIGLRVGDRLEECLPSFGHASYSTHRVTVPGPKRRPISTAALNEQNADLSSEQLFKLHQSLLI